jgi:hypothetical protein
MARITQVAIICAAVSCLIVLLGAFWDAMQADPWYWCAVALISLSFYLFGLREYSEAHDASDFRRRFEEGRDAARKPLHTTGAAKT